MTYGNGAEVRLRAAYDRYRAVMACQREQHAPADTVPVEVLGARLDLTLRLIDLDEALPEAVAQQLVKDAHALLERTEPLTACPLTP